MGIRAYISGPLTDGGRASVADQNRHLENAVEAWRELVERGFSPLCPHLTLYLERDHCVRLPHDRWIELDLAWVDASDVVLRLPGASSGADMECQFAKGKRIPVCYSLDELDSLFGPETFPLEPLEEK